MATVLALALAACGSSGASEDAGADGFPQDDITMVVTYAAGGQTDINGRAIAAAFEKELGVSVIVENIEGSSGAVGGAEVVRSKPDGLTIGMTTTSAVSRVPLIENVGFDFDDLVAIGAVTLADGLLVVNSDSPYETLDDLVAEAKKNPKKVTIAAAGAQTPQAVEMERLKSEYDVPVQLVPFQGDGAAIPALLGDQVEALVTTYHPGIRDMHEAGDIRVLATMSQERAHYLTDVPTLAESGFESLIYGSSVFLLIAPKGTPQDIVTKLEAALEAALEDPDTYEVLDGEINVPKEFIGSEELTAQVKDELEVMEPVFNELFG
ncbi:tripartite tricarboxylate transporter substrate binding protein [Nocardioides houyundeii]|uniref:tripartite tricarboxylate transporter substrate binding protein n=1 Tax=Nocardioides houyundeii TaxID=2045452 RepID=UPI0013B45B0A|nr:tripartite tricarboxylate transporter substrate binding protein [Nocardioides houyundeii]